MADTKQLLKEIEQQIAVLAESTVSKYKKQAIKDGKQILEDIKANLIRWTTLLAQNQIKVNEFEWLVNSDKELIKMKALENAGLAAIRASAFASGVINVIIDTTLKNVAGNSSTPVPAGS